MIDATVPGRAGGRGAAWCMVAGVALAICVFAIDTLSPMQGAVAVLYLVVVLLVANMGRVRPIAVAALACMLLTVVSYASVHRWEPDAALLRCVVSLSAIAITAVLALRNRQRMETIARQARLIAASHASIAESERRYRAMFETARVSFWEEDYSEVMERIAQLRDAGVTDLRAYLRAHPAFVAEALRLTRITDVNQATVRMLGAASRDDILGRLDAFMAEDDPTFMDVLSTVAEGNGQGEGETRLRTVHGEPLTVLFAVSMPLGPDRYDRVLVSVMDISDRKRAEQALIALQAELAQAARVTALGEMSATIAHEVNQPLAAIATSGEAALRWLRRPQPDVDEACVALERVVRDARRASDIVHRVRSVASNEPRQHAPFELAPLFEECGQLLAGDLSRHGIRLAVDVQRGLAPPKGDRVQMQQVVMNLMANAIRAMSAATGERRLAIRALSHQGGLLVEVADTGAGIPESIAANLFDAFVTTRGGGMGMGLAICRSTVESHGGRLWASNRPEGGATFHFTLPPTLEEAPA